MENREIALVLRETADLLEIAGEDSFRIRSYRRAADSLDTAPERVIDLCHDPKRLMAIPGIGRGMCANIQELASTGKLSLREELLQKYRPEMLELLNIQGLGPRTISLLWDAFKVSTVAEVEKLAREHKIRDLPRMGAKQEDKILKSIESYRTMAGRFLLSEAARTAEGIVASLAELPEVVKVVPAGSLRRGRETVGDLDILVAHRDFDGANGARVIEKFLHYPGVVETLAQGGNKVSVKLYGGMQVDLRLLPPESFGAALQYFTGSKQHNVALRQRAIRLGFKLNEYGLFREDTGATIAGPDEHALYSALGLDWIPPELRENCGEIEAAEMHALPDLIQQADLRGDVHVHTVETDGRGTIEQMADAARERGYSYIAITDHSQNLAMANGLDEIRALAHIERIRAADEVFRRKDPPLRIFTGIEVDILGDGRLDLADEVLAHMDVVIGSIHSHFKQTPEEATARVLRAIENPYLRVFGHPTGRLLLRREPSPFDVERVLEACRTHGVAIEINASPDRLDANDLNARLCRQKGIPLIINTDAHQPANYDLMRWGVMVARRAWLERRNVLNSLGPDEFLAALRPRP
jgi:DNA polymerase (family 10)